MQNVKILTSLVNRLTQLIFIYSINYTLVPYRILHILKRFSQEVPTHLSTARDEYAKLVFSRGGVYRVNYISAHPVIIYTKLHAPFNFGGHTYTDYNIIRRLSFVRIIITFWPFSAFVRIRTIVK